MIILKNISSSNCLERFDPNYYSLEKDKSIKTVKLKHLATVFGGKRLDKGDYFTEEETKYKYLRVGDIKELTVDINDLCYIDWYVHDKIKQYTVNAGDVILTIVGATIGKLGLLPETKGKIVNLTENAVKIIPLYNTVSSEYLLLAMNTRYVQVQMFSETVQTGVPKLAIERIYELDIPVVQTHCEIVDFFRAILSKIEELKKEEGSLKDTIEPFLFQAVMIEKVVHSRIFFSSADLSSRFDFLNVNANKRSTIKFSKGSTKLRDLVYSYQKGNSPKPEEIYEEDIQETADFYPLMRIQDITKDNRLHYPLDTYVRKYIKGFNYIYLRESDLIFAITGATIGKVAFINEVTTDILLGSDLISVQFIEGACNPEFIYFLFTTSFYQDLLKSKITGQTNGHLDPEDILDIDIPVISTIEQDKIVKQIRKQYIQKIENIETTIGKLKEVSNTEIEKLILEKTSVYEAKEVINAVSKVFSQRKKVSKMYSLNN